MTTAEITDVMYQLLVLTEQLPGPELIISMVVGIVISIIQAATQIHEQTLTFLPKLVVIGVILVINGSNMLRAMQDFTKQVFEMIAR